MANRRGENFFNHFFNQQERFQMQFERDLAKRRAYEAQIFMARAKPSGQLGDGRLACEADLQKSELLSGEGLVIGGFNGKLLTYKGDGSIVTFLRAGGGKNTGFVFPNLAYSKSRSLVVLDLKEGENAYASYEYRSKVLGHECIFLNPFGLHGLPNTMVNPLSRLLDIYYSGRKIDSEYDEIAQTIIPNKPQKGDNDWVRPGAQRLLTLLLNHLTVDNQTKLNMGTVWIFANAGGSVLQDFFDAMKCSTDPSVKIRAEKYEQMARDVPKEWSAYKEELSSHVSIFKPGTAIELSTRYNQFDFADLKKEPHTVYVMLPASKIEAASKWIGLTTNHIIESVAAASGDIKTTLILDEMPQYFAKSIPRALRIHRGRGINLWAFSQSRESLFDNWNKDFVSELETQAAVTIYKNPTEPKVLKDLEYWSGNKTILNRNVGHNAGFEQAGSSGLNESKRPVLQSEDILALNQDKHIIRLSNMPHLIIADTVHYYQIPAWNEAIKDVREMHAKGAEIVPQDWGIYE